MLFLCTYVVRTCYREIFHSEFLHIIVNESVFPTQRYCNRVPGGLDDLLSSVLLYTHVLYEGKDVRVYRILLFCSITLLAKDFSASQ